MMKWDNELRKMQGSEKFNYSPEDFWNKAQEIRDSANKVYY